MDPSAHVIFVVHSQELCGLFDKQVQELMQRFCEALSYVDLACASARVAVVAIP